LEDREGGDGGHDEEGHGAEVRGGEVHDAEVHGVGVHGAEVHGAGVHGEEVRGGGRGAVVVGASLLDELQLSTELNCSKLTIYMKKIIGITSSIPTMIG